MVDEHSLKKHVAANSSVAISSDQKNMQTIVNGNNARKKSLNIMSSVSESMDNVNLSDTESGQPVNSTHPHQIRGKHFSKLRCKNLSPLCTHRRQKIVNKNLDDGIYLS